MFNFIGAVSFVFAPGAGTYILKHAQELSESTYHASGEILGPGFHLWAYRIIGLLFVGFSGFIIYVLVDSILS